MKRVISYLFVVLIGIGVLVVAGCEPLPVEAPDGAHRTGDMERANRPKPPAEAPSAGQHAYTFQRVGEDSRPLNYQLYLPEGWKQTDKRYPLIVYLHGKSLRGDDPRQLLRYGLPRRLQNETDFPFIVLSPQLRGDQRWTDAESVMALLDSVISKYPVDTERIYLTGFSMGGGGAWRIANRYPERFAAVAPLAGRGDVTEVKGLATVPVWAFHGTVDTAEPIASSQHMVDAINAAGGNAKLTVLEGRPHDISDIYDSAELYEWFLQHRRLPDGTRLSRSESTTSPVGALTVTRRPAR